MVVIPNPMVSFDRRQINQVTTNFPIWSPFANLFPKWGRFERISGMVLFCTWFAWILHAKRNLHWRHRGQWTRGWQPAAAAGDFRLRSVPPVKLAISSLCWNRSFDWQFPRLRVVGCRGTEATEAISEALNGAAAAGSRQQDLRLGEFPKPPTGTAVCFA